MKNYIKSVIFTIILISLILLLGIVFTPKNNELANNEADLKANGILGEKENTIDVIVIGDSLTYSSFIPLEMFKNYGFTSYICGTHAQMMFNSYRFLEKSLEKQKPKVVILETNALFRKYSAKKDFINKLEKTFPFFEYHNRWKTLKLNDITSNKNYTYTDPMKGYMLKRSIKPSKNHDYMKHNNKKAIIPEGNYKYLEMMKKKCEENGIKFILVSAPSLTNYNYSKHNTLKEYAKNNKIDYINLNIDNITSINWNEDTTDKGDHLNYKGAKKVSNYLGNYLYHKYNLTDKRDDVNYKNWLNDLSKYEKLTN